MKKYSYALIILAIGLASVLFINLGAVNLPNPNLSAKELEPNQVDPKILAWTEDKPLGIYLYQTQEDNLNKYLVYTRKELSYNYLTSRAEQHGQTLRFIIITQDAFNDDQCKEKQYFYLETMDVPDKIELFVDGKEINFQEIFVGK